jgi:hypothetical protein
MFCRQQLFNLMNWYTLLPTSSISLQFYLQINFHIIQCLYCLLQVKECVVTIT